MVEHMSFRRVSPELLLVTIQPRRQAVEARIRASRQRLRDSEEVIRCAQAVVAHSTRIRP
jgi:hypothetical protein